MKRILLGFIIMLLIISMISVLSFSTDDNIYVSNNDFSYSTKTILIPVEGEGEDLVFDFNSLFRESEKILKPTEDILLTLTNPDFTKEINEQIKFLGNTSFTIRGIAEETNIFISIFIYDSIINEFIPIYNEDGNNTWFIEENSFGLFTTKNINLIKSHNRIKVVAYKNTDKNVLIYGKDVQVTYFTLNLIQKELIERQLDLFFRTFIEKIFLFDILNEI